MLRAQAQSLVGELVARTDERDRYRIALEQVHVAVEGGQAVAAEKREDVVEHRPFALDLRGAAARADRGAEILEQA